MIFLPSWSYFANGDAGHVNDNESIPMMHLTVDRMTDAGWLDHNGCVIHIDAGLSST